MMPKDDLSEKIDLILKYTKSARRWAVFRGVISFLFFLIFVVLPIIGGFYLAEYLKNNVDWSKWEEMKTQFENVQNLGKTEGVRGDLNPEQLKELIRRMER